MGYVKEPEGVDLTIKGRPLSAQMEKELTDFISSRKMSVKKVVVKKRKASPAKN